MAKKIICSIFASMIIAFTIFLIIMNIPEKNHDESIIGINYNEIQEKFFSKELALSKFSSTKPTSFKFLILLLKATKVTSDHQKLPKFRPSLYKKLFFFLKKACIANRTF